MKTYIKEINGRVTILPANKIVIFNNNMQTINPTHDVIIADGWREYISEIQELHNDKTIEEVKTDMIERILVYDSSEEVNGFFVNDQQLWLDKATRVGLMFRIEAELENAKVETTLWFNGTAFTINLDSARKMLKQIELYASECYDNTQRHIACVNAYESISDVELYDYKTGYPEKLKFNI